MLIKNTILTLVILISATLLLGCREEPVDETKYFPAERNFCISIKTKNLETSGTFFIDGNSSVHLLHNDPASNLCGMEEVFDKDSVTCYFNGIEYTNKAYFGGTSILYRCIETIENTEPTKASKTSDTTTHLYENKNYRFELIYSQEEQKPLRIEGEIKGEAFVIKFPSTA